MKFSKYSKVYEIRTDTNGHRGMRVVRCVRHNGRPGLAIVGSNGEYIGGGFDRCWDEFCGLYNPAIVGKTSKFRVILW